MSAENVYHTESDNIFNDGRWTLAPRSPSGQSMNMHERRHMGQSVGSVKVLPLIGQDPIYKALLTEKQERLRAMRVWSISSGF
jgi:hypothetical protein